MRKRFELAVACALALGLVSFAGPAQTQFYPGIDKMADKVAAAYRSTPCEQIATLHGIPPDAEISAGAKKAMVAEMKHNDSERDEFINRVAPAIAGKLFECGFIP